jgi:hypothetical protein
VLKSVNGSALIAGLTVQFLAKSQVQELRSPLEQPEYNGSCEACTGSMKTRTHHEAARQGRATRSGADDLYTRTWVCRFALSSGKHDWQAEKERKGYDDLFPKAPNYFFEHRGWQFLGFDSMDGPKPKVAVREDTLKWLDETLLKLDKKKPLVFFTHFPLGPLVI